MFIFCQAITILEHADPILRRLTLRVDELIRQKNGSIFREEINVNTSVVRLKD